MGGRAILIALIVIVVVGTASVYIQQRQKSSSTLNKITSLAQIEGVSATECTYPIGSYGSGTQGQLFIYGNKMRIAISQLSIPSFSGNMEAVVAPDGTRIVAPSTLQIASGNTQRVAQILDEIIAKAPWQCAPWWFPDQAEFNIEGGVAF